MSSNASFPTELINDTGIPFVYPGEILAAAIALPLLGILAISLRFWVRKSNGLGLGADDWTILGALPFTLGMAAMMIYGVAEHSVGYPSTPYPTPKSSFAEEELTETTPRQTVVFIVYWATWVLMIPANGLIKLSAILMYRRVFVVNSRSAIDIITKVMFVVCVLWTIGFFFAQVFGCGTAFYKPFGTEEEVASCNTNVRLNGLMVSDLLTDVLVWLIPFPVVWTLQMSIAKKLGVTGILLLATISIVAAIIRLKVELGIASGGYSVNVLTVNIYWSNIESSLALIAACLPTLKLHGFQQRFGSAMSSLRTLLSSRNTDSMNDQFSGCDSNTDSTSKKLTARNSMDAQHRHDEYELHEVSTMNDEEAQTEQKP